MTTQQLLADIHALETELLAFERKYGIRSEIFYAAFMGGEEPENRRVGQRLPNLADEAG